MRKGVLFLLGLLLLGILTYFCFQDKADSIRHELESEANSVLISSELDNAKAKLQGRGFETTTIMELTGEAPSNEIKSRVASLIGNIPGITGVNNQLVVKKPKVTEILPVESKEPQKEIEVVEVETVIPSPYIFDMSKDQNGSVILSGYVDSNDSYQTILNRAIEIFGKDKITDDIKVAKGAPKDWESVIYIGLDKLKDVDHGDMKLHDLNYAFNGYLTSGDAKMIKSEILKESNAKMTELSDYTGNFEITIPIEKKPIKKESKLSSAKECQKDLVDISASEKILFEYGKATINKNNTKTLDKIVKILKECNFDEIETVEIGGHTDSIGSYESNKRLSQKRADNVRSYLIEQGIEKDKLIANGYGERKPIVSNMLKAGRAKNRRIEFIIKEARK